MKKIIRLSIAITCFILILPFVPSRIKNVYAFFDDGILFLHSDVGEIDSLDYNGNGNYCLYFSSSDEGKIIPIPSETNGYTFIGWKETDTDNYYSQITSDLNGKTLIAIWSEDGQDNGGIIVKQKVIKPTVDDTIYEYSGDEITYRIPISDYYDIYNDRHIEAGKYNVRVELNDKANFEWEDGGSDDLIFLFTIHHFEISWTWTNDNSSAVARIFCPICNESLELNSNVTVTTTKGATNDSEGEVCYVASVLYNGKIRSDFKLITIPKTLENSDENVDMEVVDNLTFIYILITFVVLTVFISLWIFLYIKRIKIKNGK